MDKNKINTYTEERSLTLWRISIAVVLFFLAGLFISKEPFKTLTYISSFGILSYDIIISFIKSILKSSPSLKRAVQDGLLSVIASIGLFMIGKSSGAVGVMLFFRILDFICDSSRKKAEASVSILKKLCPQYADVKKGDIFVHTPIEDVCCGDTIVIKSGDIFPLDGVVVTGESLMDLRRFTNEAQPRQIGPGSEVISGAVNAASPVYVKVTHTSKNSAAAVIKKTAEDYSKNTSALENTVSSYASHYTAFAFIASIALIVLSFFISMGEALKYYGLILLSISSPRFLLSSVSCGFLASFGRLLKDGILIKGSKFIEAAAAVKRIVFDKNALTLNNDEHKESIVAVSGLAARGIETILTSDTDTDSEKNNLLNKIADHTGIDKVFLSIGNSQFKTLLNCANTAFYGGMTDNGSLSDIYISAAESNTAEVINAADGVLMTNEPSKLLRLYDISRKSYQAAVINTLICFIAKLIIIALMILGKAEIWQAILLDSCAAVISMKNALYILKDKRKSSK